ncbi:MAG: AAA family ATPase [Phycisphaerales bacterium]|jgi:hypothetical protein|nr:AAA family ATPase [Phycisphaerales bacterium]
MTPSSTFAPVDFDPVCVSELVARHRDLRPLIVDGMIRAGEVTNIVAPPKLGKSWLVQSLALCVASGRPWLGKFQVRTVPVLFVDNELHAETLAFRFRSLMSAMKIDPKSLRGKLHVDSARCRPNMNDDRVSNWCQDKEDNPVGLVIIDALYRFLVASGVESENDNAAVTKFYNRISAFALSSGAAVVLVHHTSRGNQADREVTDIGAGAGAISRAPDNHFVLRPHLEDRAAVLAGEVRSWQSFESLVVQRDGDSGLWTATALDPSELRRGSRRQRKPILSNDRSLDAFLACFLGDTPKDLAFVVAEAVAAGWSTRAINAAVKLGKASRRIYDHRHGNNTPSMLATVPPNRGNQS